MKSELPSCKRGRPREFDFDVALAAAMVTFWRHGYEGTSLTDLTNAMGINRPSLYAAFGNKEQLFGLALDRYERQAAAMLASALDAPTARDGIERVLRRAVPEPADCSSPAGCFLIVAAMSCSPASQAVRDAVAARRRASVTPALRARFARGVDAGELHPSTDVDALAAYFATVLQGLGVQAASGVDRDVLRQVIDVALRAWPNPPG